MSRSPVPSKRTSPAFQQMQSLWTKLSDEEKKKLRLLFKVSSEPVDASILRNRFEPDWLLEGIISELARRGLRYPKRMIVHALQRAGEFESQSAVVRTALLHALKQDILLGARPRHQQLIQLGRLVARALAEYLSNVTTVSFKLMLNNAGKSLEALDASYPGYLQSGMLGALIGVYVKVPEPTARK